MAYKPSAPFTVPMKLLVPTTSSSYGVVKKTYPDPNPVITGSKDQVVVEPPLFFGSFRTFGGKENSRDGIYTVINTATIDTWYRPDIKADCQIYLCDTGDIYEIVSDPEDIDMRHQYMQFKVQKTGGKA